MLPAVVVVARRAKTKPVLKSTGYFNFAANVRVVKSPARQRAAAVPDVRTKDQSPGFVHPDPFVNPDPNLAKSLQLTKAQPRRCES